MRCEAKLRNPFSTAAIVGGAVFAFVLPLAGCSEQNPWETVYPATGQVTFRGQPVANAEIALFPEDSTAPETVRPRARSTADGEFAVWTYERGDGAPAGRYKATVVQHDVVVTNGAVGTRPNKLPRKYARAETTDLVIEVSQAETQIPRIELK